jgi:hypothetical protein
MLVVSVSYQDYQKGAASNQLTDIRGGESALMIGDSESVDE